jgi:hypothetical protein
MYILIRRAVKKFPEIFDFDGLLPYETAWWECYWSLRTSFAWVARRSSEEAARQVAGRDSGSCITITHRATHRLLSSSSSSRKKHFCQHPTTALSGSRWEWLLAVPCSENGYHGDKFRNHGGHKIECDCRTPKDSKRSLLQVLPILAGSFEQMYVSWRVLLWRWLGWLMPCH